MIQRKQTLWLFLAAILNAGLFFFDIYSAKIVENGATILKPFHVRNHYPFLIMALIITILPLITIFLFKNRKRQLGLAIFNIVAIGAFVALFVHKIGNVSKKHPEMTDGSYGIGAVLPLIALIFIVLAIVGIRKDSKLVRSQDRLR